MKRLSMVTNSLGRQLPETFFGKDVHPYQDPYNRLPVGNHATRLLRRHNPGDNKLLGSLREAIEASGLKSGMCIATHHHLRNGDAVLNQVVREIDRIAVTQMMVGGNAHTIICVT